MTNHPLSAKEIYRLVGMQIRKERNKRRLTQEELGSRIKLTRTSITNIEKGRQKVLLHTLFEISQALNAPLEELLAPLNSLSQSLRVEELPPNLTASVKDWILSGVATVRKPSNEHSKKTHQRTH